MKNIKIIELVNGKTLIGPIENTGKNTVLIKKPIVIGMNQEGLVIMPPSPFAVFQDMKVKDAHIISILQSNEEIANVWNERFGSGIVMVKENKQLIV